MKQIIKGKIYNTETATEIADWSSDYSRSDFRACTEILYVSPRGRHFLYGHGGPMTRWSQRSGDMTYSGKGIEALTEDEALEWCERHRIDDSIVSKFFKIEEA